MKDQTNRDIMAALYRLVEKYEVPPTVHSADEAVEYFKAVHTDVDGLYTKYGGYEFAQQLAIGLYAAIERKFKEVNPGPFE